MKKLTVKALTAAMAMAVGGQAFGAIDDDNALAPWTGDGGGELFLAVVDRGGAAPKSFVLDLGVTALNFLSNPSSSMTFNNPTIASFLAGNSGLVSWSVAAADNRDAQTSFTDFGYLTTSSTPMTLANSPAGFAGISGAMSRIGTYLLTVNNGDANVGANNSYNFGSADPGFYDTGWQTSVSGWDGGTHGTETGLDSSMAFYYVNLDPADGTAETLKPNLMPGSWMLSSNGVLTYSAGPAPVPVPAAVWLLGSALVGLVGIARRRPEVV